ncbi:hypothetical protein PDQ36_27660 [Bacillus cereus]|jgi:hypothetical protein|uniref:hypothetical protein n=1 Tax=Bacillus cereus group TaxID=86661 RepID=UPI000279DB43|nr:MULTISPECIES: hypothetical protein [Bacillus cereus group]ANV74209.1 hypothetical protein BCM43_27495 [Bacillus thuringiensis]EJR80702.1 hypothetical protein IKA_05583 [Bacillus cereus VD169]MDA2491465.1 hypothetical protein [Bacillus cereus]MDA2626958.1 hypothetical protein [Bacillus cereus]PFU80139.1 hypothetical protein COK91_19890 [Bacillus cereus]
MGFKLPKEARNYFKLIDQKDNKFKTLFDKYYLCLMVGLCNEKLGKQDEYESADFVEGYPQVYADKAPLITGLLINAEMERQGINSEHRPSVEGLILQLIDNDSTIKLSEKGLELLNSYAAGGMNIIRDSIPKTSELETFLVHYHRLLNSAS